MQIRGNGGSYTRKVVEYVLSGRIRVVVLPIVQGEGTTCLSYWKWTFYSLFLHRQPQTLTDVKLYRTKLFELMFQGSIQRWGSSASAPFSVLK